MSRRIALLIGTSEYLDSDFRRLVKPSADVDAFAQVLRSPNIGDFDEVIVKKNERCQPIREAIDALFIGRDPADLILLYYSGHGIKHDASGKLFLAATDTRRTLLQSTGVGATFITDVMDLSRSKRQVLILDCCHSGAFAAGSKSAHVNISAGVRQSFEGRENGYGRVVLTASDAIQYAWEGNILLGSGDTSVFTSHLVAGLKSGLADRDGDGSISLDELYEYTREQVTAETAKQTPQFWNYKGVGRLVLAQAGGNHSDAHRSDPAMSPLARKWIRPWLVAINRFWHLLRWLWWRHDVKVTAALVVMVAVLTWRLSNIHHPLPTGHVILKDARQKEGYDVKCGFVF